jgi:hypothetical protein
MTSATLPPALSRIASAITSARPPSTTIVPRPLAGEDAQQLEAEGARCRSRRDHAGEHHQDRAAGAAISAGRQAECGGDDDRGEGG